MPVFWLVCCFCFLFAAGLAVWRLWGGVGGWVAECSVHRIAARKFTSPTPSQTEAGCRRGDSTLHTVHENTHKHTTSLWIVNYTLTEHHHMSTESVRGLLGGLVDAWHLCGSRGEGEGIMCGFPIIKEINSLIL